MVKKKKSYNPFKMWGSWVGIILYLLLVIMGGLMVDLGEGGILFNFIKIVSKPLIWMVNIFPFYKSVISQSETLSFLVIITYGFLLGWGIHSLFRRLRK